MAKVLRTRSQLIRAATALRKRAVKAPNSCWNFASSALGYAQEGDLYRAREKLALARACLFDAKRQGKRRGDSYEF